MWAKIKIGGGALILYLMVLAFGGVLVQGLMLKDRADQLELVQEDLAIERQLRRQCEGRLR